MNKFILGWAAGLATYHIILVNNNNELVSELRGVIQKLDDKLAEAQKDKSEDAPIQGPGDTHVVRPAPGTTPPPSPPKS